MQRELVAKNTVQREASHPSLEGRGRALDRGMVVEVEDGDEGFVDGRHWTRQRGVSSCLVHQKFRGNSECCGRQTS